MGNDLTTNIDSEITAGKIANNSEESLDILIGEHAYDSLEQIEFLKTRGNEYIKGKQWEKAIEVWQYVIDLQKENSKPSEYTQLSKALRLTKQYSKGENVIKNGLTYFPHNSNLLIELAQISMDKKDWKEANNRWETIINTQIMSPPIEAIIGASITNQILGDSSQSKKRLSLCMEERKSELYEKYNSGYKKVVLFNNGETSIEFYKRLGETKAVFFTFDPVMISWKENPFGFNFLIRQNVDIIAIRHKNRNCFHQDLSKSDFDKIIVPLIKNYEKKIAYGFSLGGYSALYYCSNIDCEIIALSPRNPAHPIYGEKKFKGTVSFNHNLSNPYNPNISPIIVYDPKDKIEGKYVKNELIKSFPNSSFLTLPYVGHSTAKFLLDIGFLKNMVLKVLKGNRFLFYDRNKRFKSSIYLRNLGRECLRRNKINWALSLANRAIEKSLDDHNAYILKIDTLMEMNKYEEAVSIAENAVFLFNNNEKIRLLLIELYCRTQNIDKAKGAIENSLRNLKNPEKFIEKVNKISNKFDVLFEHTNSLQ